MAKRGLPAKYAKMGFKKGWREYKKAQRSRGKPKSSSKSTSSKKKGGRRMGKSIVKSVMKFLHLGVTFAPAAIRYTELTGDSTQRIANTVIGMAGIGTDRKFHWDLLGRMWLPSLAFGLVRYGIPKINGMIRRM